MHQTHRWWRYVVGFMQCVVVLLPVPIAFAVPLPHSPPRAETYAVAPLAHPGVSSRLHPSLTVSDASWEHPCGLQEAPTQTRHVIMLWFENQSPRRALLGPSTYELASRCGHAENYYGLTHPSLPNYLAAVSGSTHGLSKNCFTCQLTPADLLGQVSWKLYAEAMPSNCDATDALPYAAHHNFGIHFLPWGCATRDVPMRGLWSDLSRQRLPAFSFILPDDCHSMHTNKLPPCSKNATWKRAVWAGDAWLHQTLKRILASPTYRAGHTVIFVAWDEGEPVTNQGEDCVKTRSKDCHTMMIAVSPSTHPGSLDQAFLTPYSLLRTTEHLLGVPYLGGARSARGAWGAFNL